MSEESAPLFCFAQFEFPWRLGTPAGRYVLRAEGSGTDASHVLVVTDLDAPQRRLLGAKRRSDADPEPAPAPVHTSRATLIDANPATDEATATRWLKAARGAHAEELLDGALETFNVVLHAQRAASADASVHEVTRVQALVSRVGYGKGDQVAEGQWSEAVEIPYVAPRTRRDAALRPQERLAAILGGRDQALISEELALRARADLIAGRDREAALQLRVALEAGLVELAGTGASERLGELTELRGTVGDAANAALLGPIEAELTQQMAHALGRLEAALRLRTQKAL